jgi:hypothetical protein
MASRGNHATGERDGDPAISTWLASPDDIGPGAQQPAKANPPAVQPAAPQDVLYGVNLQMGQQGMSVQANPTVAIHLIRAFADVMAEQTREESR